MLEYKELKEAIDNGYIKTDKLTVVRREGRLVDYVLSGEPVREWEVVTAEPLADVLAELLDC